jgi:hypothetical protein
MTGGTRLVYPARVSIILDPFNGFFVAITGLNPQEVPINRVPRITHMPKVGQ